MSEENAPVTSGITRLYEVFNTVVFDMADGKKWCMRTDLFIDARDNNSDNGKCIVYYHKKNSGVDYWEVDHTVEEVNEKIMDALSNGPPGIS